MGMDIETLTGLGIPQEAAEKIIAKHEETVRELQKEVDRTREEADAARIMAEQAAKLGEALKVQEDPGTDWEAKYRAEKAAFDALKAEQAAKAEEDRKKREYRALLLEEGIKPIVADSILQATDVSKYRFDDAGRLENPEAVRADISRKWAAFKPPRRG